MNAVVRRSARLSAEERELVAAAAAAMKRAYAPYSKFKVGAAIRTWSGEIICGCNLENASFGATVCAERNAVAQAVVAGCRKFVALAVVTPSHPPAPPCGLCRQVLVEFADDMPILLVNNSGELVRTNLQLLLPFSFTKKQL